MASVIMEAALQHKARIAGVLSYSTSDLARESGLAHSVIFRAIKYQAAADTPTKQPTLATVQRMATALALPAALETLFYNAFGYASPAQIKQLAAWVAVGDILHQPPTLDS